MRTDQSVTPATRTRPAPLPRLSLTALANKFGTDKGTTTLDGHAYTLVYEALFENQRDNPINLLEIGLSIGGPELGNDANRKVTDAPSVQMWHEYFPNAHIYESIFPIFHIFNPSGSPFFALTVAMKNNWNGLPGQASPSTSS